MQDTGYGYCQCGCGEKTPLATKTNTRQGQRKGKPNRYILGHKRQKHPPYLEEDRGYKTPCWIWQGAHDRFGYGLINRKKHRGVAHIYYYKRLIGPVPPGAELDHLCRVRDCVNPSHLEPVTHAANVARGVSPSVANAAKTHCIRGHAFTPENTYRPPRTGHRQCRTCLRIRNTRWYQQKAKGAGPKPDPLKSL